ncbi:MAG: 2-aminoadipate transaminase [Burkholderia plantarii]|nr:MAG: 2-aminoadipate transaminase [Burkholderia plantarii]
MLSLILDASNGVPMTDQLVTQIEAAIRARLVTPGARLPSIRKLAEAQRISRFPVVEAYDRLVARGLVEARHGSGFYVGHPGGALERAEGGSDPRLAEEESSQILQQFNYPGETLKLSGGFIPESWRDVEGITQAIRQAARTDIASVIDYALPYGDAELRRQIQLRLATLGVAADLPNILVTAGASQAFDLIVRFMLKPGDTVFVEDPGYYNLFGLLKLQGVRLVAVPRRASGPDPEVTEALLRQHRPKLFFINTALHNPTASNVSPTVAFRLLQLAQQHGVVIVEDDIYADFQAIPTQRFATLDGFRNVVYIGGLSKTLSSSIRIGYVVGQRELIKHLVDVKVLTSLGGTRFSEAVVSLLLQSGAYRKYIERLRRRVRDALSHAVRRLEAAGWAVFDEPGGGNFVWARVPGIDDSLELVRAALPFGVTLAPGSYYRPHGDTCAWVRINTAQMDDARALRFIEQIGASAAR